MIKMKTNVTAGETPEKITVSMIDQDLKNGISKSEMTVKYGIKPWEVDEMFKHPFLKGRRPSKKKPLSFKFIDDMTICTDVPFDAIDPNQVTLEEAIEESTKEIETAVELLEDVNNTIVDMLGPTNETPEETLLKAANGRTIDELDAAEPMNEQEEELEMDDDTFEL